MTFLRSLLTLLVLGLVMAPPPVLATDDNAALGEQQLAMFEANCPVSIGANFARQGDFNAMDERDKAALLSVAGPACACAAARMREFPPADLPRLFGSDEFRRISQRCIASEMKSKFGALCRVQYRQALPTASDESGDRVCDCAQVRVDATSNEQFARLLTGENGGVDRIINECMRSATPAPSKDPTP